MTKNIATVEGLSPGELIARLEELGFGLESAGTGSAVGFSLECDGRPVQLPIHEAANFVAEGNGVLLWRGASESLYLSTFAGKPRIYFDGFTASDEDALCKALIDIGITFSIAHEDSAYEA